MYKFTQLCLQIIILICIFNYCVDGFTIGRSRTKRSLSKRLQKNGFDILSSLKNLNSGYQYISSFFKYPSTNDRQNARIIGGGSSALSGVENCDDCFLGMQVSRREAYVVSGDMDYYYLIKYNL